MCCGSQGFGRLHLGNTLPIGTSAPFSMQVRCRGALKPFEIRRDWTWSLGGVRSTERASMMAKVCTWQGGIVSGQLMKTRVLLPRAAGEPIAHHHPGRDAKVLRASHRGAHHCDIGLGRLPLQACTLYLRQL